MACTCRGNKLPAHPARELYIIYNQVVKPFFAPDRGRTATPPHAGQPVWIMGRPSRPAARQPSFALSQGRH
ncbi:hypothetical protein DSCA_39440 [Desulfosarcina alkanivorans]|uniref:Uncharacterized protein n=1 Tax=Desulfosarcina alkanivorans TaxID=571177 RepID=A0A5K7YUN6_9BACT|nr:hypothetical protein DSCA_39440 [Desulfosarcina alkanivorans]